MPLVFAVLAAVLYVALCGAFVWFVLLPFAGWTALVGAATGAVAVLGAVLPPLAGYGVRLLGPDDVHDPARDDPGPDDPGPDDTGGPAPAGPDDVDGPGAPERPARRPAEAWPHHLAGQVRVDLAAAAGRVRSLLGHVWGSALGIVEHPASWVLWPLWLAPGLALVAGTVGAVVVGGVVLAVAAVLAGLATVVWAGVGWTLHRGDALLRHRNRAAARCPSCFWRTTLPHYACACSVLHRDVRPGRRLGVLWHRCRCGRTVPTTVSRAGTRHTPHCPDCGAGLERGSGVYTDVSLPVFGSASAGKTSLLYAGLAALREELEAGGGSLVPRGDDGERRLTEGVEQVVTGRVVKTEAGRPVVGLVSLVTCGRRRALLHTFDAAGESFADRRATEDLRFLDEAGHLVLVVDPFSVPRVADRVLGREVATAEAAPAVAPPAQAYEATVVRLRDQGARLDRTDLAVVVVKADLLLGTDAAEGIRAEPAAVRDWLVAQGEDGLVTAAERDFGTVGWFLVSSRTGWRASDPHTAAAPLRWLGTRGRLPLPPPVPVAQPAGEPA